MVAKTNYEYQQYWDELFKLINHIIDNNAVHPNYVQRISNEILNEVYSDSVNFIIEAMETYSVDDFEILAEGYISDIGFLNDQAELYLLDTHRRESVVEFIVTISNLCGFGETTDYKTLFRKL